MKNDENVSCSRLGSNNRRFGTVFGGFSRDMAGCFLYTLVYNEESANKMGFKSTCIHASEYLNTGSAKVAVVYSGVRVTSELLI
jgi:hypothetical protein